MASAIGATLKVLFWCALTAEFAWLVLGAWAWQTLLSALGQKGAALVHLLILGTLAVSSSLLVAYERRVNTFNEPEREWTLAETLYAVVLFCSLFFGIYAIFGWYYAPEACLRRFGLALGPQKLA